MNIAIDLSIIHGGAGTTETVYYVDDGGDNYIDDLGNLYIDP